MRNDQANFQITIKADRNKYQVPIQAFKRTEILNSRILANKL